MPDRILPAVPYELRIAELEAQVQDAIEREKGYRLAADDMAKRIESLTARLWWYTRRSKAWAGETGH